MTSILSALPAPIKAPLQRASNFARSLPYYGSARYCPVCEKSARCFLPHGHTPREDARCPYCRLVERHRHLWLFLKNNTDLFDGRDKTLLHIAPEARMVPLLKQRLGSGYLSADLYDPRAMVKMDITDIHYPDESFDAIYCSHVLEHVENDHKAMREFARVLKVGAYAILMVPTPFENETHEDWSIVEPEARLKTFGHAGHVRSYGKRNFVERLESAGFEVQVFEAADSYSPEERTRMGLNSAASGSIFQCRKPSSAALRTGS